MAVVDQEIEVLLGDDEWVRATVQSIENGIMTIVEQKKGLPLTQRKESEEGVTWRELSA